MTINEFLKLSTRDKLNQLWERGKFLKCRFESSYSISIYKWNNYVLEIWYQFPGSKVEKIEVVDANASAA